MVVFVLKQAFLCKVFSEVKLLLEQVKDFSVDRDGIYSNDQTLMSWTSINVLRSKSILLEPPM